MLGWLHDCLLASLVACRSKQLHESRQAELEEMLASMTTRQEAVQRVAEDKARLTEVHTTAVAKLQVRNTGAG